MKFTSFRFLTLLSTLICVAGLSSAMHKSMAAEFVEIGAGLLPRGISADGQVVVGYSYDFDSQEAFKWSRDTGLQMLGVPSGYLRSQARGVSADGSVVLGLAHGSATGGFVDEKLFLWTEDTGFDEIGFGGGYASISDDASTVVGSRWNQTSKFSTALRWTNDAGMVSLLPSGASQSHAHGVSADGKIVAGESTSDGDTWDGFIWDEGNGFQSLGPKPEGWSNISPWLLSAGGDVVFGDDGPGGLGGRPFRWTQEEGVQPIPIPVSDCLYSHLYDISPSGSMLLGSTCKRGTDESEAFVWDEHHGTRILRDVLIQDHGFADDELPAFHSAYGLSADAKVIVGATGSSRDGWVVYLDKPLVDVSTLLGDLNDNGVLDAADVNLLASAVRQQLTDARYDVNNDGHVDANDQTYWVKSREIAHTYFGDADLDGEFNSRDFTLVFLAGQYEDAIDDNSGWQEGDWDGDGDFTSKDMIAAFLDGGYEQGPRGAVRAVPEPTSAWLLMMGVLLLRQRTGRSRISAGTR